MAAVADPNAKAAAPTAEYDPLKQMGAYDKLICQGAEGVRASAGSDLSPIFREVPGRVVVC